MQATGDRANLTLLLNEREEMAKRREKQSCTECYTLHSAVVAWVVSCRPDGVRSARKTTAAVIAVPPLQMRKLLYGATCVSMQKHAASVGPLIEINGPEKARRTSRRRSRYFDSQDSTVKHIFIATENTSSSTTKPPDIDFVGSIVSSMAAATGSATFTITITLYMSFSLFLPLCFLLFDIPLVHRPQPKKTNV